MTSVTAKIVSLAQNTILDRTVPAKERTTSPGLIFNIMRFSLHDGPGIRTTVFLKGCPLSCWWCHNPEGRNSKPELMFFEGRCVRSGECVKACPRGATVVENGAVRITDACRACGVCVDACAAGARELAGRSVSAQEVIDEIEKDRLFWEEAGGGVTFSGGEPLFQPRFLEALLDACRERDIHTAVETCGYASRRVVLRLAPKIDLFLIDLKLLDPAKHRIHTGRGNGLILSNIRALAGAGRDVIIRYPVIPGINADEENVRQMIQLLKELQLRRVDLLPYHSTGAEKYRRLRLLPREIDCEAGRLPSVVEQIASRFREQGFAVTIGGSS